jgi:hypothetical protein
MPLAASSATAALTARPHCTRVSCPVGEGQCIRERRAGWLPAFKPPCSTASNLCRLPGAAPSRLPPRACNPSCAPARAPPGRAARRAGCPQACTPAPWPHTRGRSRSRTAPRCWGGAATRAARPPRAATDCRPPLPRGRRPTARVTLTGDRRRRAPSQRHVRRAKSRATPARVGGEAGRRTGGARVRLLVVLAACCWCVCARTHARACMFVLLYTPRRNDLVRFRVHVAAPPAAAAARPAAAMQAARACSRGASTRLHTHVRAC